MPQADPRALITLLILLFIIFSPSPDSQQQFSPAQKSRHLAVLARERHDLDLLNSTRYRDLDPPEGRWANFTGFEREGEWSESWKRLDTLKERARGIAGHVLGPEGVRLLDGPPGKVSGLKTAAAGEGVGKEVDMPLYKNITGVLHGPWVRSPLQEGLKIPRLNLTRFAPEGPFGTVDITGFDRNVSQTAAEGWVRVVFEEMEDDEETPVAEKGVLNGVRASLSIGDEESGDEWEAQLYGLHFLEAGNMILTTTSDKFAGIFALPHFTVSKYNYDLAQKRLNRTIGTVFREQEEGNIISNHPWSSLSEGQVENAFSQPNCELVVYLQQHPIPSLPISSIPIIESELRDPTGAFPPSPEDMRFSLLAFSPDCGYVLESKGPPDYPVQEGDHLVGLKVEVEYMRARRHILLFSLVVFAQIFLLIRQMRDASTPSTRSRISFYSISMMAMGDGFTTMTLCLSSLFLQALWVPLIGTAFLAFMSVSFFGMRFLMEIYSVQAPERERAERTRREAANARATNGAPPTTAVTTTAGEAAEGNAAVTHGTPLQAPIVTAAGADTLPLPVTARRTTPIDTGATPIFIPSDQDLTQPDSPLIGTTGQATGTADAQTQRGPGFGTLYTRFYLILLGTLFLSLNATGWPYALRRIYFTTLSLIYLSFWLPQIHRNVHRNCRRALRHSFVLGHSVLRLIPFVYFYGYSKNALFADVDLVGLGVLIAWVWVQVLVLASQEILGPRWFVPKGFGGEHLQKAYDYHPLLREGDEEGGGGNLPIGASEVFDTATAAAPASPSTRKKSSAGAESRDKGKRRFDCAICMNDIEVPVFSGGADTATAGAADERGFAGVTSSGTAMLLERRKYMVTPCRHIFHSGCLEGWMKYRLQCPVCREELPPT